MLGLVVGVCVGGWWPDFWRALDPPGSATDFDSALAELPACELIALVTYPEGRWMLVAKEVEDAARATIDESKRTAFLMGLARSWLNRFILKTQSPDQHPAHLQRLALDGGPEHRRCPRRDP